MNKILFTDLDDTLLNSQKEVGQLSRKAIKKMLEQGNYLVLSSGRSLPSILLQAQILGLTRKRCYISAYNGALIYDIAEKKVIYEQRIPMNMVSYIFEQAKSDGLFAQTYDDEYVLTDQDRENIRTYCKLTKTKYKLLSHIPEDLEKEPYKILISDYSNIEPLLHFRNRIQNNVKEELSLYLSSKSHLEVSKKGISKGSSLKFLCDYLKVPVENSVSAGDAQNDIPMIIEAGTGCVMINGDKEVKAVANYITKKDCNHDGIAEIIDKFILNDDDKYDER